MVRLILIALNIVFAVVATILSPMDLINSTNPLAMFIGMASLVGAAIILWQIKNKLFGRGVISFIIWLFVWDAIVLWSFTSIIGAIIVAAMTLLAVLQALQDVMGI